MSFDTPYGDQLVKVGDTINLDASTNWSDVDANSFGAITLPSGLSISAAGLITGDISIGGVVGSTITVVGTNGSTQSGGINWNIGPT